MSQNRDCMFKHLLNCNKDRGLFLSVTSKRLQSIKEASQQRNDDFHMQLNNETDYETHKQCVSTYTSRTHISRYLKRHKITTHMPKHSKRTRRSEMPSFVWKEHCLFCGEECCMTPDPKNPK